MASNDRSRTRKTYSFFRSRPVDPLTTTISGGFGIDVTGDERLIIVSSDVTTIPILSGTNRFTGSIIVTGSLFVSGSLIGRHGITSSTGSDVIKGHDDVIFISGSVAHVTMSLPASPNFGEHHTFKDASGQATTNNIVIDGNGKQIDGGTHHTISSSYGSLKVTYGGSLWSKIFVSS